MNGIQIVGKIDRPDFSRKLGYERQFSVVLGTVGEMFSTLAFVLKTGVPVRSRDLNLRLSAPAGVLLPWTLRCNDVVVQFRADAAGNHRSECQDDEGSCRATCRRRADKKHSHVRPALSPSSFTRLRSLAATRLTERKEGRRKGNCL